MADIYDGASLRVGAEWETTQQWALYLEGGPYLPYLKATKMNPHGLYLASGMKHYLNRSNPKKYIAVEYFYKDHRYRFNEKFMIQKQSTSINYGMQRQVHRLAFKFGKLKHYRNFTLDWHAGLGLRYIDSSAELTEDQMTQLKKSTAYECTVQESLIRKTGQFWMPDLSLGVRIGYQLL